MQSHESSGKREPTIGLLLREERTLRKENPPFIRQNRTKSLKRGKGRGRQAKTSRDVVKSRRGGTDTTGYFQGGVLKKEKGREPRSRSPSKETSIRRTQEGHESTAFGSLATNLSGRDR